MFELLFNEPLASWRDATLVFESGWSAVALAIACALAVLGVAISLLRLDISPARRAVVGALQAIAVCTVLTMLWRPALEVEELRPGENVLAWLVDGSRSMRTGDADASGTPRAEAAAAALEASALADDPVFAIERYVTGTSREPLPVALADGEAPPSDLEGSAIAAGIDAILGSVDDRGLAALVLLSDGADTLDDADSDWWQRLAGSGVPVHVVGLGATERVDDVELLDVALPERAASGATVEAMLTVAHPDGATSTPASPTEAVEPARARLRVTRGAELLLAEDIVLDGPDGRTVHVARFAAGDPGLGELLFALDTDLPDSNPANDTQRRLFEVDERKRRVLYVEGEPRWEFKFMRRAVSDDAELEIVSLLRTSANKFYRQGVRDGSELADGFPRDRETLYEYDAVIVGSLAAAELDPKAQAALRDYVSERGGTLLMLAGRQGLADGGWARSAVAPALPVALDASLDADTFVRERARVVPTRQGLRQPWLALGASDDGGATAEDVATAVDRAWAGLPEVADRQSLGRVKPGAVVLLAFDDGAPAWVTQRYGLGSSHVFGTGGTWRWQMGLPSEDLRHERFWSGALAQLAAGRPERLRIETPAAIVRDASGSRIEILARDAAFEPIAREALTLTLIGPDGTRRSVEPTTDLASPGRFLASVETRLDGPWTLEASVTAGSEAGPGEPVVATRRWLVESGTAEDRDALQRRDFLERIAETTGGSYLSIDEIDSLPALLAERNAAATREARLPLWSMPFLFLVILGAKGLEWMARLRWKRL